jgi:hypothetical protein
MIFILFVAKSLVSCRLWHPRGSRQRSRFSQFFKRFFDRMQLRLWLSLGLLLALLLNVHAAADAAADSRLEFPPILRANTSLERQSCCICMMRPHPWSSPCILSDAIIALDHFCRVSFLCSSPKQQQACYEMPCRTTQTCGTALATRPASLAIISNGCSSSVPGSLVSDPRKTDS